MKVTLNWLKEFVEIDCTPKELAHRLTHAGLEVESIESFGNIPPSVLTVKIEKVEKHPQADRLSLCTVNVGSETRQIVCGAKNMKAGDVVCLATPGTILPDGKKIEQAKIRGIESAGMLCSEVELGLAKESNGLLILPEKTPIGKPLIEALPISDTVFEINVTPNRADCLSIMGIAREIAAIFDKPLKPVSVDLPAGSFSLKDLLRIEISDSDKAFCPRYTARMIRGVEVKPSPDWVQRRLELVGIRSINNIVDATNYVMIETGQPLHAFDYDQIQDHLLKITRAQNGAKIQTLDKAEKVLNDHDLLIEDGKKPLAIAGIMGGLSSGVSEKTQKIVLESAYFDPVSVRKSSKRLGLGSESSFRFERGVDPNFVKAASERLASLILQWGGGELSNDLLDTAPDGFLTKKIFLRSAKLESVVGVCYEQRKVESVLEKLGLSPESQSEGWNCSVPTYRRDLEREIDLIEEVARTFGYDQVPSELPAGVFHLGKDYEHKNFESKISSYLNETGFSEVIHYSFCSAKEFVQANLESEDLIRLLNPLSEEMAILRKSLVPSMLTTLQKNLAKQNKDFKFYEMRPVYQKVADQPFSQRLMLCLAMTGYRYEKHWGFPKSEVDYYDLKGNIEEIFSRLKISSVSFLPSKKSYLHPGLSADLYIQSDCVGSFGAIHPEVALNFEIESPVMIGEIDLHQTLKYKREKEGFKPLPKFPSIERDLTVVVSEDFLGEQVIDEVQKMKLLNVQSIKLFDVYKGEPIPAGKKALTYSLRYQDEAKTLTDEEVNLIHTKLVEQLKTVLPIEWR